MDATSSRSVGAGRTRARPDVVRRAPAGSGAPLPTRAHRSLTSATSTGWRSRRAVLLGGVAVLALAPAAAAVTLNYGPHPNILAGSDDHDIVLGGNDGDWLAARGGPDIVDGHLGDDVLLGGPGSDGCSAARTTTVSSTTITTPTTS